MDMRRRKELVYRTMHIGIWAENRVPANQNRRELLISVKKILRLWSQDEFHIGVRVDSIKRSKKIAQQKSKTIGLENEKIIKRVKQALQDIAKKSGKILSEDGLKEQMYGENGLLTKAVEYGKIHATK
jgi:hypothetical protein